MTHPIPFEGHTTMRISAASLLVAGLLLSGAATLAAQTKLLRFPDIHGDRVVFCYGGDVWTASASGGRATRITAHPGQELFPRFSPDGRWIAFTGQYDGDEQVYVVPSEGGVPRQLTFYPARGPLPPRWGWDNQVYGWSPDGSAVLVRSLRDAWDLTDSRMYLVPTSGGLPAALPMPVSGAADLSPDGAKVVYAPLFRDFRTWKRYQGGWASDLWIFDVASHDARPITTHPRSDRDPMWIGDTVYFTSDRSGTFNLHACDLASGEIRQLTTSTTADVRWPSSDGEGRIVHEIAGELAIYDVAAERSTKIEIEVPHDGLAMRPARIDAAEQIEDYALSPEGKRALFVARGDIFTVPAKDGPTRNLTRSSGAHDKHPAWSPDGSQVAFISDADGEEEIYLVAQDGRSAPRQITDGGQAMRYGLEWSPDGGHLTFSDKEGRIWILDVKEGGARVAANEAQGQVRHYAWSPDGAHLAFRLSHQNGFGSIYVYTLADQQLRQVTEERFDDSSPAWDPEGRYLYFLSDRGCVPQIGSREWNYVLDRETGIYALALRKDVPHPFPPESDEVVVKAATKTESPIPEEKDEAKETAPVAIDFAGLQDRIVQVPVRTDNYVGLAAVSGKLVYVCTSPFYYGRKGAPEPEIRTFDLKEREESTVTSGASRYVLSADGAHLLYPAQGNYYLAGIGGDGEPKTLSTAGLQVDRVPREEWRQIFDEVWRRFRDFFYVENMHGYDWEALGRRYRPLLDHVAHRSDLNYLLGEMIGELCVSHAYVAGGDWKAPERPSVALPGARFAIDPDSGRYRIIEIFDGDNHETRYRSPLTELGVAAKVGDFVLAVDGESLDRSDNIYRRLRHRADRPVSLTLNARPESEGARDVTYRPITSEVALRYLAWVSGNRRAVAEATEGRAGYLHIPDMGSDGIREFIKWFYPQIHKAGLVIDVRGNGGGNVSAMIIERLSRKLLGTRWSRTYDRPGTYPRTVFRGHLVALLSATSASDGDIFPYRFRQAGLGPLIGQRSWGGVIGITSHGPLIDSGSVNVPQFGTNDLDGSWIIEGHGVDPDIEVANTPKSVIAGRDLQLERGIAELLQRMDSDPRPWPSRPPDPVKTR